MEKWDEKSRDEFLGRARTIELRIKNNTTKDLKFVEEYFYSGSWFKAPTPLDISARNENIGYAASRFDGFFTGVSGGLAYQLKTDDELFLYIGFTNPYVGCNKTFIDIDTEKKSAKWPYDNANDDSTKVVNKEGFRVKAANKRQTDSASHNFQEMEFTIEADD